MYWKYLGRFWDDFPNKTMVENIWSAYQPYVDSAVEELGSYMDMMGAKPNVYCVQRKYVKETVDDSYMNVATSLAHAHTVYSTTYSSAITVTDSDAGLVSEVYINGVRINDEDGYSVSYGTGSFTVSLSGTGYEATDKVCIRYFSTGDGKHEHTSESFDALDGDTSFTVTSTPELVYVNGVLYDDGDWAYAAGTVTLSDSLEAGDRVDIRGQSATLDTNHFHESLCSGYGSLTTKVSAHFDVVYAPFINGVMTLADAGFHGPAPNEFYLVFREYFTGYYSVDMAVQGDYAYKSKLSTSNIVRLEGASDAVYTANQSYSIDAYTVRDSSGAWFYHNDVITANLYCDEVWYDESIPYLLFGSKVGFKYSYTTARYMTMLKALLAYRLRPKTSDNIKIAYSAIFDIPVNLIASDIVEDISVNNDDDTLITMSSGAQYNIKKSTAIVVIGDELDLMAPLCDAVEVTESIPVLNTTEDTTTSFNVVRDALSAPTELRRMPSALHQASGVDIYSNIWGWYFDGPWTLDS